jgi:hypothetical protein
MLLPDDRPTRTDRYMVKDLNDEVLFYDARGSKIYILNATSREIYNRCDGRHSVDDLVRALVSDFEVDEATAKKDTIEVLKQLLELEILSVDKSQVRSA